MKLSETQREEIMQMYTSGEFKAREIAEMFAINQQTVYNVLAKHGIKPNGKGGVKKKSEIEKRTARPHIVFVSEDKPEKESVQEAYSVPIVEVKKCTKCNKDVNAEYSFCPFCGEKMKTPGELILDGLRSARVKAMQFCPDSVRKQVDKQLMDAAEYLTMLMRKTGAM